MKYPTFATVHVTCGLSTGHSHFPDHPDERFVKFGKIGDFGRPVVHLGIDVGRILAVPWRSHAVVPDSLKVGSGEIGPISQMLYDNLTGIQWGKLEDTLGWTVPVC